MFSVPNRLKELLPKNKTQEQLDEHYDNVELEKGDFLAMCLAAFITFVPVVIVALVVVFGLMWILVR
ncbi:MAG: hypothetical protein FWC20_04960 [Oscillospiraceae bacterium]|nr:hypothetical protein [Oscillospiraceae bacterium]MCL2278740.1 hypothetical protein [Oscillospiraceae bacterium]